MYTYIMERTQIYLTAEESAALDRAARETGRTRSSLIREAIETRYLATPDRDETLTVLQETFGAWRRRRTPGAGESERFVRKLRGPGLGQRRADGRR